jgi:hypothetical protein
MENITKYLLLIITAICLYIIFCIGLGWFWTIGTATNSENINQVLINLSYSYVAGLIFYILVSYLPNKAKIKKLRPVIKLKISDLYNQINACVQTFEVVENEDIIKSITKEQLKESINKNDMYNNSFYANVVGYNMNNLKFLNATKGNIFEIIESLTGYKEYMETEETLNLEIIRDSTFFHLVKIYEETPMARIYYSSPQFKSEFIDDLYDIIICIRKLI